MTSLPQSGLGRFVDHILRHTDLPSAEQQRILSLNGQEITFAAHRDVVRPRQKVEHACLVLEGLAARFDQMRDGRRSLTAFYIAGEMCDLPSIVAPIAVWGIQALTTTRLLLIPHAELRRLATDNPALALAFWRDTTFDASRLAKWAANVGRKDAAARIAHLFCEMGIRMEQAGFGNRTEYALPATQQQLADALGLTKVHLNRTIRMLRGDDVVVFERGLVVVHDWERLASRAEFDPIYLLPVREDSDDADPETREPDQLGV